MDQPALLECVPAEVIGQKRDTETRNSRIAHRAEVAAAHARLVPVDVGSPIVRLQMPFDQRVVIGCRERRKRGKIIESGTHDELLSLKKHYAALHGRFVRAGGA